MDTFTEKEKTSLKTVLVVESTSIKSLDSIEASNDEIPAIEKHVESDDKSVENVKFMEEENQQTHPKLEKVNEGVIKAKIAISLDENISKTDVELEPSTPRSSDEEKVSDNNFHKDESNLHYEGEVCVYTDPASKCQYTWDIKKEEWCQRTECGAFDSKDYKFDGKTYTYSDEHTS